MLNYSFKITATIRECLQDDCFNVVLIYILLLNIVLWNWIDIFELFQSSFIIIYIIGLSLILWDNISFKLISLICYYFIYGYAIWFEKHFRYLMTLLSLKSFLVLFPWTMKRNGWFQILSWTANVLIIFWMIIWWKWYMVLYITTLYKMCGCAVVLYAHLSFWYVLWSYMHI